MNTIACLVVAFSIRSFCVIILNYLVWLHHSHVSAKAPASKACSTVASGCADNHSFLSWLSVFFVITFIIITQFTRVIKKRSVQNTVLQYILRTHLLRRKDEADVYIFSSSIHYISQESPSLLRFDSFSSFCFSFSRGDSFGSMPTLRQYSS